MELSDYNYEHKGLFTRLHAAAIIVMWLHDIGLQAL